VQVKYLYYAGKQNHFFFAYMLGQFLSSFGKEMLHLMHIRVALAMLGYQPGQVFSNWGYGPAQIVVVPGQYMTNKLKRVSFIYYKGARLLHDCREFPKKLFFVKTIFVACHLQGALALTAAVEAVFSKTWVAA
jgi:hypothetical protein